MLIVILRKLNFVFEEMEKLSRGVKCRELGGMIYLDFQGLEKDARENIINFIASGGLTNAYGYHRAIIQKTGHFHTQTFITYMKITFIFDKLSVQIYTKITPKLSKRTEGRADNKKIRETIFCLNAGITEEEARYSTLLGKFIREKSSTANVGLQQNLKIFLIEKKMYSFHSRKYYECESAQDHIVIDHREMTVEEFNSIINQTSDNLLKDDLRILPFADI